jgi:hypothetical protein
MANQEAKPKESGMKGAFSAILVLAGAACGGIYPGSAVAVALTASTHLCGSAADAFCFIATLALGVGGALAGWCAGRPADSIGRAAGRIWLRPARLLIPLLCGLIAGLVGYYWLDWELSHGPDYL